MSRIEISPEWLAGLKELAEKATPGPWIMGQDGEVYSEDQDDFPVDIIEGICVEQSDAAFIAAASPDVVLAMASEIERLNKEIKSLREIENGLSEDNFSLSSQYVEDNKKIAQLEKEAAWLAQYCEGQDQCPYLALNWEYNPPDWCQCTDTIEEGFDCYMNPIECWREAARNAIAQGNANDRQ